MSIGAILLTVFCRSRHGDSRGGDKYIMHGWGWGWHRDHHEPHDKVFEKNDLYAVTFGTIVFAMFAIGYAMGWDVLWWTAFGITCYGLIYTLVHDGLVHQRYWRWVPKRGYAKRLVQAHRLHHGRSARKAASVSVSSSRATRRSSRRNYGASARRARPSYAKAPSLGPRRFRFHTVATYLA